MSGTLGRGSGRFHSKVTIKDSINEDNALAERPKQMNEGYPIMNTMH
jgi:hypothetical protein